MLRCGDLAAMDVFLTEMAAPAPANPFDSGGLVAARGVPFTTDGRLNVAGLRLAWQRRRGELAAVNAVLPCVQAAARTEEDRDATSHYVLMMQDGLRRGAVEAAAYGLVQAHQDKVMGKAGSRSGGDVRISSVRRQTARGWERVFQPRDVRAAVQAQGEAFSSTRPANTQVAIGLMRAAGVRSARVSSGDSTEAWSDRVFSEVNFDEALRRMRPAGQAPGVDGYRGVLLRWAPRSVREQYRTALVKAVVDCDVPAQWSTWCVTFIPKKDRDSSVLANNRDLWNPPHGWKLSTHCMRVDYNRVQETALDDSQRGFRADADAGEAASVAVLQTEQAASLCVEAGRSYLDLKGFFMAINRGLMWALEAELGVQPGVTRTMKLVHDAAQGVAHTRYGLTDAFKCLSGTGQGCVAAPVRATLNLLVIMSALLLHGDGFEFVAPPGAVMGLVKQEWFADDLSAPARNAQGVQLSFDVAFYGSWVSGNVIGVDAQGRATKSAYMLSVCGPDGRRGNDGYVIVLPTGEHVPRVHETYRLLGHEVGDSVGNSKSRDAFVYRAKLATRLLSRLGGLELQSYGRLVDTLVVGLALYYGGPTPIDWPVAETVAKEVRKAAGRLGARALGGPRLQAHAPRDAGGLGLHHVYVHTGAATVLHVDKALRGRMGAPHRLALESELALTAHRLGFVSTWQEPTPLDW